MLLLPMTIIMITMATITTNHDYDDHDNYDDDDADDDNNDARNHGNHHHGALIARFSFAFSSLPECGPRARRQRPPAARFRVGPFPLRLTARSPAQPAGSVFRKH